MSVVYDKLFDEHEVIITSLFQEAAQTRGVTLKEVLLTLQEPTKKVSGENHQLLAMFTDGTSPVFCERDFGTYTVVVCYRWNAGVAKWELADCYRQPLTH